VPRYVGISRLRSGALMRGMIARGVIESIVTANVSSATGSTDELTYARAHHEAGHARACVNGDVKIKIVTMRPPIAPADVCSWPEGEVLTCVGNVGSRGIADVMCSL
jgi:hypothetical protein